MHVEYKRGYRLDGLRIPKIYLLGNAALYTLQNMANIFAYPTSGGARVGLAVAWSNYTLLKPTLPHTETNWKQFLNGSDVICICYHHDLEGDRPSR